MSSAPREARVPLTHWQYFTKTLYHNAAQRGEFSYNKVIYAKSETLRDIEYANSRLNMGLILLLITVLLATKLETAWIFAVGLVLIVAGEIWRLLRLPRDITAHLTDTGRRER